MKLLKKLLKKKPTILSLDVLYLRLYMRENRREHWDTLGKKSKVPQFLIDEEERLLAEVRAEIAARHKYIRSQVFEMRS